MGFTGLCRDACWQPALARQFAYSQHECRLPTGCYSVQPMLRLIDFEEHILQNEERIGRGAGEEIFGIALESEF